MPGYYGFKFPPFFRFFEISGLMKSQMQMLEKKLKEICTTKQIFMKLIEYVLHYFYYYVRIKHLKNVIKSGRKYLN